MSSKGRRREHAQAKKQKIPGFSGFSIIQVASSPDANKQPDNLIT
jgi:hypothetical protein